MYSIGKHSSSFIKGVKCALSCMGICDDARAFKDTLARIHAVYEAHPEMNIAPSHCGEVYRDYVQMKSAWGELAMNGLKD